MPKLKLTKQRIDSIPYCPERQIIYRDNQLRGFGLRVSRHTKTFIAEAQVRGRTVRVTIGRADLVPIEAARRIYVLRHDTQTTLEHPLFYQLSKYM